ncbi:MAG: hypothetical protein U9Q30_02595 [Campylobacterota bacterium]|nr:hypothetical protein [Campylobacterota bacterium]
MVKNLIKLSLATTLAISTTYGTDLKKTLLVDGTLNNSLSQFKIGDGKIYFMADDNDVLGNELWTTDGTKEGTYNIADFTEGASDSPFTLLTTLNNRLILRDSNYNLLMSDGNGISYIKDTASNSTDTRKVTLDYYKDNKKIGNQLFFSRDVDDKGDELWKTDGTTTTLIKDIREGTSGSNPNSFEEINGKLIFLANDGLNGQEMWISDGTTDGTELLLNPNATSSSTNYYYIGKDKDNLYFHTSYYISASSGYDYTLTLWKTDGTKEGTTSIYSSTYNTTKNTGEKLDFTTDVNKFTVTDSGKIYFMATHSTYDEDTEEWKSKGEELWTSDGSSLGTKMVEDFNIGSSDSNFHYFRTIGEKILFRNYVDSKYQLWVSDGTSAGTYELKTKNGDSLYTNYYYDDEHISKELNGKVFLYGKLEENDKYGYELYVTDGTSAGTNLVKDITPDDTASSPQSFYIFNDNIYFKAYTPNYGYELWKSDGTTSGTQMVHDIYYGSTESSFSIIGEMDNKLYLQAKDTATGYYNFNIYSTDGEVTIDENNILDVNSTKLVNDTKEMCKNNPASCGIYTTAPEITEEFLATKGNGWHMVGTSTPITNMNLFNGVDTVWKWSGTTWKVYSPNPSTQTAIKTSGIESINELNSFDGVWIRKK